MSRPLFVDKSLFVRPTITPPSSPFLNEIWNDAISGDLKFYDGDWKSVTPITDPVDVGWVMDEDLTLTASDTIGISTSDKQQLWEIQGNSGAVTLSTTPFGSVVPTDGVVVRLVGRSDDNHVTVLFNDAAKGVLAKGDAVLGLGDVLTVQYLDSIDRYVEVSRNM
jgi:hypothetical protein